MNPFLPLNYCIPDVEARVFGNRCYLYGSYDNFGDTDYCSDCYHVFSAEIDDLENWTDHGVAFTTSGATAGVPWSSARLYAPDVIEKNGTYYLYFCLSDGTEGVATAGEPTGPFTDAVQLFYPQNINNGVALNKIDPAVFIDDDGSAYYYWGQFQLEAAGLLPDMKHLDASSYNPCLITESTHWFHEGASLRKFNDKYYLLFCSLVTGRANTLDYAISDNPLGPFEYCGSVINNACCDPNSWNIHGSVAKINNQAYIFYHRSSNNSKFSRRTCVEKIYFDLQGKIIPVEMTSMGFSDIIPAQKYLTAAAACERFGLCYLTEENDLPIYKSIHSGDWLEYKSLYFTGMERMFSIIIRAAYSGTITVQCIYENQIIAFEIAFSHGYCWQKIEAKSPIICGRYKLRLTFHSGETQAAICDVKSFCFLTL